MHWSFAVHAITFNILRVYCIITFVFKLKLAKRRTTDNNPTRFITIRILIITNDNNSVREGSGGDANLLFDRETTVLRKEWRRFPASEAHAIIERWYIFAHTKAPELPTQNALKTHCATVWTHWNKFQVFVLPTAAVSKRQFS